MLLNLIVAVILEHFSALGNVNPDLVSASDIADFGELWATIWTENLAEMTGRTAPQGLKPWPHSLSPLSSEKRPHAIECPSRDSLPPMAVREPPGAHRPAPSVERAAAAL